MLTFLKDHFVPHKGNGYQPRLLQLKVAAGIFGLILAIEAIYLLQTKVVFPQNGLFGAIFASALVDETNLARSADSLGTLTTNATLERAAQMKADDMAAKGYFAHNSPDGKTPWYWFAEVGYDYAAAGENLAVNFSDSKDVIEAWMRSPKHRANIMNGNYTEIGIATAHGMYKGKDAIFIVQEFGRPSLVARDVFLVTATATPIGTPEQSALPVQPLYTNTPGGAATTTVTPKKETPTSGTIAQPIKPKVSPKTSSVPTTSTVAGSQSTKLDVPLSLLEEKPAVIVDPSHFDLMLASPHQTTTTVYLILAAILAFALTLAVFIKIRIQHPHILANGVLLIGMIIAILLMNAALGGSAAII